MIIITLLTDFGDKDGFTGMMKGVIWSIAAEVQIVDLAHEVEPQNIRQAALILAQAAPFFPKGTIHVAVIDPGVGTARRPMALHIGDQYFVGPDNGIFSLILQQAEESGVAVEAVLLDRPDFWLPRVSHSFHGRDIFSPVAAYIAKGWLLSDLGSPLPDPVRLQFPAPVRGAAGWRGEIIAIDHFGNLITNLNPQHLGAKESATLTVGEFTLVGISETFGDHAPGELVAMLDSFDKLSLAVVNGSAADRVKAKVGDPVQLFDFPPPAPAIG